MTLIWLCYGPDTKNVRVMVGFVTGYRRDIVGISSGNAWFWLAGWRKDGRVKMTDDGWQMTVVWGGEQKNRGTDEQGMMK